MVDTNNYIVIDQITHIFTIILVIYLIYRDNKTLNLINNRYDKLIEHVLDTITKQQNQYKNEISADIRELSTNVNKVIISVRDVVSGVKDVANEVTKVNNEVNEVTDAVVVVAERTKDVTKAVSDVVAEIRNVNIYHESDVELTNTLKSVAEQLYQTSITLKKILNLLETVQIQMPEDQIQRK